MLYEDSQSPSTDFGRFLAARKYLDEPGSEGNGVNIVTVHFGERRPPTTSATEHFVALDSPEYDQNSNPTSDLIPTAIFNRVLDELNFWTDLFAACTKHQRFIPGIQVSRARLVHLLEKVSDKLSFTVASCNDLLSRLSMLRTSFIEDISDLEDWLFVSRSTNPRADAINIPDRFIGIAKDEPEDLWDSSNVRAVAIVERLLKE